MSLRAKPPPTPPSGGGDASRFEHVLAVGFQMLSINPEPIEMKRSSPGSGPSTADTEQCRHRRTLRSESNARSAQSKKDLQLVGDDEVNIDEESGVHEFLGENYKGVTSMEDAMEAEEKDGELDDARVKRNDKINAYQAALKASSPEDQDEAFSKMASAMAKYAVMEEEEEGELGNALFDMTVKVLTYRKTLRGDSIAAQDKAFEDMVAALALYTSLENESVVERGINEMVYVAYEKTFENPYDTNSRKKFQFPEEHITHWGGMPARPIRDFDLKVVRKDRTVYIKLSARAKLTITNKTWTVSNTELPLAEMQRQVLEVVKESGAIRTNEGMQTPSIKARLKAWLRANA